ncbi:MAG: hypothetical protein JXB07_07280 [Anaerolineae bacterium]|nr:hypothetical protein [Anaerolineae bacterium]
MPHNIAISSSIKIPNGPMVPLSQTLTVDAYDKIDVTIPANTTEQEVQLVPAASPPVSFMLVASDWYGGNLSYTANAKKSATVPPAPPLPSFNLDSPHLLMGRGALTMMVDSGVPQTLYFDNQSGNDAHVVILIGRDATP